MEEKYEAIQLKNQLCYPIYLCAKEIIREYTPLLEKLNLTYTQYIVMMYFWEKKESNAKEISRTLILDPSTLTPLLKKLETKQYLQIKRSEKDGRNLVISITQKGLDLRDKAVSIPTELSKCIKLSKEEAETLYKITYKIISNIQAKEQE